MVQLAKKYFGILFLSCMNQRTFKSILRNFYWMICNLLGMNELKLLTRIIVVSILSGVLNYGPLRGVQFTIL